MMRLQRVHTRPGCDVFEGLRLKTMQAENGAACTVPAAWEPGATEILVEKIFYKSPLPPLQRVAEGGVPAWLHPFAATGAANGQDFETCITQVLNRVAGGLAHAAWTAGVFADEDEAQIFHDELRHLLLHRIAMFDLPVLSGAGLSWAYGVQDGEVLSRHVAPVFSSLARIDVFSATLKAEGKRAAVLMQADSKDSAAFIRRTAAHDADRAALKAGRRLLSAVLHRVMDACDRDAEEGFDIEENYALKRAVAEARKAGIDDAAIADAISYARQGFEEIPLPRADEDEDGADPVLPVLSLPDAFIESALTGHGFALEDGRRAMADKLWDSLGDAVWRAARPQILFRDTVTAAGFLEGAAPDLSGAFLGTPGDGAPGAVLDLAKLDAGTIPQAAAVMTIALDAMARGDRRPVVLGLTNAGAFLMRRGLAYDGDAGRAVLGAAAALMSGTAFLMSARIAEKCGAFPACPSHEKTIPQNLRARLDAFSARGWTPQGLMRRGWKLDAAQCPDKDLARAAQDAFARAYVAVKAFGLRHAHLSGIGPVAETEILLGAESAGIAPLQDLVRFGADGGVYARGLSPAAVAGLHALKIGAKEIDDISFHVLGHGTLLDAPFVNHAALRRKGFHQAALDAVEGALQTAHDIRHAFSRWTLGAEFCAKVLKIDADGMDAPGFDLLESLGFAPGEIRAANLYCCGSGTFDNAPHLDARQRAVFTARISPDAQVRMQAAVEPFLTGCAAHVIRLDAEASIDAVQKILLRGWELGVKTMRLHRPPALLVPRAATVAIPQTTIANKSYKSAT